MKNKKLINRLPVTRKALFKDILKNRWRTILLIALMLCVFALPLLASSFFKDFMILNLIGNESYFLDGVFTIDGANKFRSINFIFLIINSFCIILFFICLSGVFRVFRQLIWSEGISFFFEFRKGIKENVFLFLRFGVLTALLYFTIWSLFYFANNALFGFIALGIASFVIFPLIAIGMYYSVIYKTSLLQRLHNIPLIYIKNVFLLLLVSILLEGMFFLELIPSIYIISKQAIILLVCGIILPLIILIGSLVTIYIFDKDINRNSHKDIYRKGLY